MNRQKYECGSSAPCVVYWQTPSVTQVMYSNYNSAYVHYMKPVTHIPHLWNTFLHFISYLLQLLCQPLTLY